MPKLIAIIHTIAWCAFWSFGFLALTTPPAQEGLLVGQILVVAAAGGIGMFTWLWLVRHAEATGYARPRNRARALIDETMA